MMLRKHMGSGHESQKMFGDVAASSERKTEGVRKIEPQRFALKKDPPTIILEFKDSQKGSKLYMRRFTIKKLKPDSDPRKVTKNLQIKCKEYLSPDLVATEQLQRLVTRLIKNIPCDDEDIVNVSGSSAKSARSSSNNNSENKNLENQQTNSPQAVKRSSLARTLDNVNHNEGPASGEGEDAAAVDDEETASRVPEAPSSPIKPPSPMKVASPRASRSPKKQPSPVKQMSPKAQMASPVAREMSPEKTVSPAKAALPASESAEEEDEDNYSDFEDDFEDDFEGEEEEPATAPVETAPIEVKKESPTEVETFDADDSSEEEEEKQPKATVAIDGTINLNRVSQADLKAAKAAMDTDFIKNRVKPGDENYEFDKRVDFAPADDVEDDDSWDDSSEEEDEDYSF